MVISVILGILGIFCLFGSFVSFDENKNGEGWVALIFALAAFAGSATSFYRDGHKAGLGLVAKHDELTVNWTYRVLTAIPNDSFTVVLGRPDGKTQLVRLDEKVCVGDLYTAKDGTVSGVYLSPVNMPESCR